MRRAATIRLTDSERRRLLRWRRDRTQPRRARRAAILLCAARGWSNQRIAASLHTDVHTVARWRTRFARAGFAHAVRERPRGGRPATKRARWETRVLAALDAADGGGVGSVRGIAARLGISHMLVARIRARRDDRQVGGKKSGGSDPDLR